MKPIEPASLDAIDLSTPEFWTLPIAELRREYGRADLPFENHVISFDGFNVDGVKKLADLGVTDVIVGFRNMYDTDTTPLQKKIDALRMFAEHVIAKE